MQKFGKAYLLMALSFLMMLVCASSPRANAFQDLWGIATDPLKLGKSSSELSASLDRTLSQLDALEASGNYDATQRLEQIRSIINGAIGGTQAMIDKATAEMEQLETKIDQDAITLIYRAQCAIQQTIDQGQHSFADYASELKQVNPGVYILGIKVMDIRTKDVKITDPDQAYAAIKKLKFEQLKNTIKDNSPAYNIVSVYQNLAVMAKFTLCHYLDVPSKTLWALEISDMNLLLLPWTTVVTPTLTQQ